jgi:hypothetical protein
MKDKVAPSPELLKEEERRYYDHKPLSGGELNALLRWAQTKSEKPTKLSRVERMVIRLLHNGYMPEDNAGTSGATNTN